MFVESQPTKQALPFNIYVNNLLPTYIYLKLAFYKTSLVQSAVDDQKHLFYTPSIFFCLSFVFCYWTIVFDYLLYAESVLILFAHDVLFRWCVLFSTVEFCLYSVLYSILWWVLYSIVWCSVMCPKPEKQSILYSLAHQALKRPDAVVKSLCLDYGNQSSLVLVSSSKAMTKRYM